MNNGFYTLVYMLWLYIVLLAGLYWISFILLDYAYRYMIIIVQWYSFNDPVNCNCLLAYQSIYFSISSIAIEEMQLLISCYMYSVNCSIAIESIGIQLQLQFGYSLTAHMQLTTRPKVPPLQFFLQNRI